MKKNAFATVLIVLGLAFFSGCSSMYIWADYEQGAENKMLGIEENIADGLKTGALSADRAEMFLTTLKGTQADYEELKNKVVYQEKWNSLHDQLDALRVEINNTVAQTTKTETPMNMDRIPSLQRDIEDGRISGDLPVREEQEFQARLHSIRRDYLSMTMADRPINCQERVNVSLRLDSLVREMERYR